jgi:hypothetical protein
VSADDDELGFRPIVHRLREAQILGTLEALVFALCYVEILETFLRCASGTMLGSSSDEWFATDAAALASHHRAAMQKKWWAV